MLTPALTGLLVELLRLIREGDGVTVRSMPEALRPLEAAAILGVTLRRLDDLASRGALPAVWEGGQRRFRTDAVHALAEAGIHGLHAAANAWSPKQPVPAGRGATSTDPGMMVGRAGGRPAADGAASPAGTDGDLVADELLGLLMGRVGDTKAGAEQGSGGRPVGAADPLEGE